MFANFCTLCVALVVAWSSPLHATEESPAPVGDWTGALSTPQGNMRLWITIEKDESGKLSAVLESIDQAPGQKIPVTTVEAEDGKLTFAIQMIGARYSGVWNADEESYKGTFQQGIKLPLNFKRGKPEAAPVINGMDGIWRATVERAGKKLRLVVKLNTTDAGTLVTFDALDAPAYDIPVANFTRTGDKVSFEIVPAAVHFEGTLNTEETSFSGTWQQMGQEARELTFERDTESNRPAFQRPQNPTGALPYKKTEVKFANTQAVGVTLAGTLTVPEGKGPFPAAILISGSGPSDRDESFMGHKPFLVLSDHLTRNGIAVLRYDDRGTGQSTGDYSAADSRDFAADANAAFKFLKTQPGIDPSKIGFIGHSEGGLIAPIALQTNENAAFMVMLAGPGTDTVQLVLSQAKLMGQAAGHTDEELARSIAVSKRLIEATSTTADLAELESKLDEILTADTLAVLGVTAEQANVVKAQFTNPWYRFFITYDPADYLPQLRLPILAIGGTLDLQVPTTENLAGIRALTESNPDVTIRQFEGLNHLFQRAKTGAMGEYRDIEETFSPIALEAVSSWIKERF